MGSSDTLRSVIDAGRSSKRLDELSSARVIGKIALQLHAVQQKAGAGKAVGPVTPTHIRLAASGEAKLELGDTGVLGYSSPEQLGGATGDRRSDVFSLGAVLWEALTYSRLFDAMNDAAVKVAVQEREIVPPSEINANVPAELSAICMRALSRNPSDRYQSVKAMAVELEEFLEEAGYEDSDAKIAQYLASMNEPPKQLKISMAPLARPASSTQPPPVVAAVAAEPPGVTQPPPTALKQPAAPTTTKQPAAPTMLGEAPKQEPRPKSPSGAALAAALADAGKGPAGSNGSAHSALPPAKFSTTAVGVPKLDEWQDGSVPTHAPPPPAAPVVSVDPAAPASAASSISSSGSVPMTPLPPVLPSGSAALRTDKSTISVSVPPQVKVSTVEAKHVEPKQPALIVDDKPPALIVDTPPPGVLASVAAQAVEKPAALIVDTPPAATIAAAAAQAAAMSPSKLETMTTLVDAKPPEIEVPKLVDGRLPEPVKPSAAETLPVMPAAAATPSTGDAAKAVRPASQSDAVPGAQPNVKSAPHPAAAVSLGPIPGSSRDSKDILAGWGWGTDKHNAIAPDGYVPNDDDDFIAAPNTRKTLMYVIGGGLALAALVTIIAVGFGGSPKKKAAAGKTEELARPAIDHAAPPADPAPTPEPPADPGSAQAVAPDPNAAPPAAASTETAQADAAKAAAAQAEAASAAAAQAEAAKQDAAKAELAKQEAAKQEAAKAELAKQEAAKADAARIAAAKADAATKAEAKKQEQARLAAERQTKADAARAEAARVAAAKAEAKKAEQARKAEQAKKAELARKEAAKTAPKPQTVKRPATTPKSEPVRTAKTEPKAESKLDAETAYRVGLQQFARGDTAGALSSLRTSLAGNPSYAPTWRGLGLVFEKMGEKDQARAAFKRYLQLAPNAGDADNIRGRLEKL